MPPGEASLWHLHKVPSFVYALESEVSVDYGPKGAHAYSAGQTMLKATDCPTRPTIAVMCRPDS